MADGPVIEQQTLGEAAPAGAMVPAWHVHRRLYDWVLSWAHSRHSGWALFGMSFAESSFFPIPPDVLLMPLVLGNRRKWLWFATMCSIASVVGGIVGYLIGLTIWQSIDQAVFSLHIPGISAENFVKAGAWYEKYDIWLVAAAGFTPLPYKVITISAGMFKINFLTFVLASAASRSARFFLVAALMGLIGPSIKPFIDKYFNWLCILFMVLLVGGFAVLKHLG